MPHKGQGCSAEHRERISRGLRRFYTRRRAAALIRPAHVDTWLKSGVVSLELRPVLEARAAHVEDMVTDLGGAEEVTAMQRRVLDGWLQAQVAADVEFQKLARNPNGEIPERLMTALNSARSALIALGLSRRARDVTPSLETYLKEREASQDGAGRTISTGSGPLVSVVEEGGSS